MEPNVTSLEIIGKESHFNADSDFILDNQEFEPTALQERKAESVNPVLITAMTAVLILMFLLVIIV